MTQDDFQAMKDRAIAQAMQNGAATYIDRLIEQIKEKIPPTQTFTRAELLELLRGVSQGMRGTHGNDRPDAREELSPWKPTR